MNSKQIEHYVMQYLDATACHIVEKGPAYVTVKLSPEADQALTHRPYYWSFVERTGAEPETMTFTFVFERERMEQLTQQTAQNNPAESKPQNPPSDSILGRYFGVTPNPTGRRALQEHLTYGNAKLHQIFNSAKSKGKYVHLYEVPLDHNTATEQTQAYSSWLVVNYKLAFICDMKRDEIHSLGISLSTGVIIENFHPYIMTKMLTPKLPAQTHLRHTISLAHARIELEQYVLRMVRNYDNSWADKATERMQEELSRIHSYYEPTLEQCEEDVKQELAELYHNKIEEIQRQYKPRVQASVINCGIFHLLSDSFLKI